MPFDETITQNKIQELIVKQTEIQNTRIELHETINALQSLLDTPEELAGGSKGIPKMKKPKDQGTGADITDSRRDEVFEACILKADQLLS